MRVTLPGAVLVTVLVALVVAMVLGIGHRPWPEQVSASLVEVRDDDAGQPVVEVADNGSGDLARIDVEEGPLLVRPDQFLCRGGSLTDLAPGLPVVIEAPAAAASDGSGTPVVTADLVVIECGT